MSGRDSQEGKDVWEPIPGSQPLSRPKEKMKNGKEDRKDGRLRLAAARSPKDKEGQKMAAASSQQHTRSLKDKENGEDGLTLPTYLPSNQTETQSEITRMDRPRSPLRDPQYKTHERANSPKQATEGDTARWNHKHSPCSNWQSQAPIKGVLHL